MAPHRLLSTQSILSHPLPSLLTLHALPSTDIWSVPPSSIHFSAPFICTALPITSFHNIVATVSANFTANTQQGGLLLVLPAYGAVSPADEGRRWITATLEYEHEGMNVSVVSCERWSDWCLRPLGSEKEGDKKVVLKMERLLNGDGSKGTRLRVSMQDVDGKFRIIREVTWAFEQDEGEIWVGVLANQASEGGVDSGEEVKFENLIIETW